MSKKKKEAEGDQRSADMDDAKLLVGGMPYFYFTREELMAFVKYDLRTQAQRLYLYMRLHCDSNRGISHTINYEEIGGMLKVHRTTILRALAALEDAELINPRNRTAGETYDLPFCIHARSVAEEADRKKKLREAEKKYAAEKQSIEAVLSRRLTQPEKKRLKEKHGLLFVN